MVILISKLYREWLLAKHKSLWCFDLNYLILAERKILHRCFPILIGSQRGNNRSCRCRNTIDHFQCAFSVLIFLMIRCVNILCCNQLEYSPRKILFLIDKIKTSILLINGTHNTVNDRIILCTGKYLTGFGNTDTSLYRSILNHNFDHRITITVLFHLYGSILFHHERKLFLGNQIAIRSSDLFHLIIAIFQFQWSGDRSGIIGCKFTHFILSNLLFHILIGICIPDLERNTGKTDRVATFCILFDHPDICLKWCIV